MAYRVWGFQLELQSLLCQNVDDDDDDDDDNVLGNGNWGLEGLKPKAEFLMLLCCEHDLQGLGFPVGAPKTFFFKMMMMMMMMMCWGLGIGG